jgi:ketosteroid isomerase-like protein/quercetin dioxygenase-like cupin family protein
MRPSWRLVALAAIGMAAACTRPPDVDAERAALLAADREWSESLRQDVDSFLSYLTPDATIHIAGLPRLDSMDEIREEISRRSTAPGYAATWSASEAAVSAGGDLGYTVGAYSVTRDNAAGNPVTETGKYVAVWKKHLGLWKAVEVISNADTPPPAPFSAFVLVSGNAIPWTDDPASMPPGARSALLSGDPAQPGRVTVRVQLPAGYRLPPHHHPDDEHLTVLSGTIAVGLGNRFDETALTDLPTGSYVVLPAISNHYVVARTAATVQYSSVGPLGVTYANPADDPRNK